jgi:hypothetical protein
VAELADAHDSKSCSLAGVWVRLPPSALKNREKALESRVLTNVGTLLFIYTEYDSRRKNRVRTIVFGEVNGK